MNRFRKVVVASLIGGAFLSPLGLGVFGKAPAHAAAGVVECTGTGTATTSGVALVGGSGSYSFSGPAHCSGTGDGDGTSAAAAVNISSSGTFNNIVCGTGSATGSATVTLGDDTYTINYNITFVSGQGALTANGSDSDLDSGPITGVGHVTIAPTQGDCVTPVTAFTVVYNIALEEGA